MFCKHHLFKLVAAIVVAASIAVVGARTAKAGNSYNPGAYVYGGASPAVSHAIQSVGFGSKRSVTAARRTKVAAVQGLRLITDTLGGSGQLRSIPALSGRAMPA